VVYFTFKYRKIINALHNVVDDLGRFFADAFAFDKTRAPTGEVALASVRVCQPH
jgi:hypothetical protein